MGVNTGLISGNVKITFLNDAVRNYEEVSNISIGRDWVFIKFVDGSRTQIPYTAIREIFESPEVFIKGVKDSKEGKKDV